MEWAGLLGGLISGTGIGVKITDWLRERDARKHAAQLDDDKSAQEILQSQVDDLSAKLDMVTKELARQGEQRAKTHLRFRLRIQRLEVKVKQLESERDAYKKAELEALERERALLEREQTLLERLEKYEKGASS